MKVLREQKKLFPQDSTEKELFQAAVCVFTKR